MGHFIIKINDMYLEWSTVVDAPISYGMNLEELTQHVKDEYGNSGVKELPERLERVEKTGTSAIGRELSDFEKYNRAGPNEKRLTLKEIYQAYCLRKPIRNGWLP